MKDGAAVGDCRRTEGRGDEGRMRGPGKTRLGQRQLAHRILQKLNMAVKNQRWEQA